ncbi:serine hydrolase domain-containing protein [Butyrivibrio sp. NC3005]|uniref:serine hydrolase domain-containing protein n=1 Tax=Butyrivibrio sp. NC3005 TaxID=1280685 RepID=UPI00040EE620|nr:serine hydrolase [Butyrivibrio sp. NC3005]
MNIRKLNRLDTYMDKNKHLIPGASLLVEHNGKRVYEKVFGVDRKDSIYRLFSMTKPLTALAAMILYERGDLDLLSPVSDILPAFKNMKVASPNGIHDARHQIYVRDLLNMTSGIVKPGDYGEAGQSMNGIYREARIQRRSGILKSNVDVANKLAESYLMFEPGEGFHMGLNAEVLSAVIEQVSGERFSDFMRKYVFEPLHMSETNFYIDGDKAFRQSAMMMFDEKTGKVQRADANTLSKLEMEDPFSNPWIESGGNGLYSTMEDYAHFCEMLINKGSFHGKEIIGKKTYGFMTTNNLDMELEKNVAKIGKEGYGYGNYFFVMTDTIKNSSNGSKNLIEGFGEAGTYFMVDPQEELIIIFMQQIDGGLDKKFYRGLRQIVFGAV